MAASFNVKVDVQQLKKMSFALDQLALGLVAPTKALNDVAYRTFDESRKRMIAKINLSDEYVRGKMTFRAATEDNLQASISVEGKDNTRGTPLTRFDTQMVLVAAKSPHDRLKGNAALGIQVGMKQAGVRVEVSRGDVSSGFVPRGFLMPLRAGSVSGGNGTGLFSRRKDDGKKKQRYGPPVYQMFRFTAEAMIGDVEDWLSDSLVSYVGAFVEKQFK